MSDLNFGDHTNRNIVKNPLLSTAVLGLSLEELNNRAVLLPAAPQPTLVTGQDSTSPQQAQKQSDNQSYQQIITNIPKPPPNLHNPTKSTDAFDVNEYFARLEGTRYVSAPINAEIPDKTTLEAKEQNLEEVNLNETREDGYHQSITSDIAQNFSQLPNVLPQMASAVFSSFSNMLSMTKREVADVQGYCDEGFKKVDLNADDLGMIGEVVKKDVLPPPKEPPVGSTSNTYRITTKKKAYAHIPGLSSNQPVPPQDNIFNPPPSHLNYNYFNPNDVHSSNPETTAVLQDDAKNANFGPAVDNKVANIFDQNQPNQMNVPVTKSGENLYKSASVLDGHQSSHTSTVEPPKAPYNISIDVTYGPQQQCVPQNINLNTTRPPQIYNPPTQVNQMDNKLDMSKPMAVSFECNVNAPIIPPPTMFSSPPKAEGGVNRNILPPSVAKRLGRNQPGVKNTSAVPTIETNIFVPPQLSDTNPSNASATSFLSPPGFTGSNVMHAPSNMYASPEIPSPSSDNTFISTFDGNAKLETSPISAFATTSMKNLPVASFQRQSYDHTNAAASTSADSARNFDAETNLNTPYAVSNQNLVEGPIQYDNPAPMRFDPAKIIQPIVEPPKPVPEPPKMQATNVNFRLNKKRPQYYSGPIEGVGAISNNFKPIIAPTNTNTSQSTFHGALFTPPVSFSDVNAQDNQDVISTDNTPSYHHITPTHKRDVNVPTAYDYRYEAPQTQNYVHSPLDCSRQTTDYYDEPKTDTKGFGIIGSLKSKLSSIDINKIQNTVTTFFDPAYNDTVKNESVTDDNDSYQSQNNPSHSGDSTSLEILVPSMEATLENQQPDDPQNKDYQSQYTTYFGNNNFTNQGHYKTQNALYQEQQFYTGSYYTEDLSDNNATIVSNSYMNVGPSLPFDASTPSSFQHNYFPENFQNKPIGVCDTMAVQQNEANTHNAAGFASQEQSHPLYSTVLSHSNISEDKQRDNVIEKTDVETVNKTDILPPYQYEQVKMINPMDFFNQPHDASGSIKSDDLQQNQNEDSIRTFLSTSNIELNKQYHEKGNIGEPNAYFDEENVGPPLTVTGFFNKSEGESLASNIDLNKQYHEKGNIGDPNAYFDEENVGPPLTATGFFNKNEGENFDDAEPSRNVSKIGLPSDSVSVSDFLIQSAKDPDIKTVTDSAKFAPFNISSTPLINLSTLLAEKSVTHDLEDSSDFISGSHEIIRAEDNDDLSNTPIPTVAISDSVREIDICETCREVNKEDESDTNEKVIDLTTQLIQNIISPIQLLNPVEVPLPEAGDILKNNAVFASDQIAPIGAIRDSSVTDLINDEDIEEFDKTLKITSGLIGEDSGTPYGWKPSTGTQESNVNNDHAFSFQPNASTIGFYGDNSLFFDQTPRNASDALMAGLNINTLGQNTIVSQPSAPNIDDLDDAISDMTGRIDVQLIEQDAKSDFEEFIVEPSEADNDKEKENISRDPVKDTSSFTERVEEFKSHEIASEEVFSPKTSSNPQQTLLRTDFTSPTTMASYFDTGNYAADAYYRKSATSPSSANSFEVGSPKQITAMATVTASNVQILPSIIPPNEKDDNSTQVPLTKGIFTLESLSNQRIDSTEGLTRSNQAMPASGPTYTDIRNIEMLSVFPDIIRDTKQSGDYLPQFHMPGYPAHVASNISVATPDAEANISSGSRIKDIESSKDDIASPMTSQIFKPQPIASIPAQHKLEDPMAFFQTEPKMDQSEGSCNRLASYFSSPPKSEQSKSFFELSQSQNHLRQNPEASKKEYKTFYELSQTNVHENVQPPIGGTTTDVKVAPFNLFKELTSVDNYTPTKEQTTRHVNYFSVEYDLLKNKLNRDHNIGEPDAKAAGCSKSMDNNNKNKHKEENIDYNKVNKSNHPHFSLDETSKLNIENNQKNTKEDLNTKTQVPKNESEDTKINSQESFLDVIKACDKCNSLFSDLDRVNVGGQKVFKLRQAMDTEHQSKPAQGDVVADTVNEQKMSFEFVEEEEDDKFSIVTDENRQSSEYVPVKFHWFYRVDCQGKSVWRGFSATDSQALEEAHNCPSLNEETLVPTDGGRFDVNIMGRLRVAVYWHEKPTNVRRCSWFYKGTTDARYVPYTESIAEKLEEEYRAGMTTGSWHRRLLLSNNEAVIMHTPSVCVHLPHSSPAERTSHRIFSFSKNVYRNPIKVAPVKEQPAKIDHLLLMIHGAGEWRNQKQKIQSTMRPRVVRRGIDESEIEDTEPSRIDHLLLLCHGVGSACDMKFRSVEQVVDDFRMTSVQLIQAHYKSAYENGDIGRIEVLPIAWHSSLHSGESGVDKRLSMITLDSIPLVRSFTNDAVLDVLFYTSPKYCQTIIDTVCAEMNRIYTLFMSRNRNFYGGVSLGGHSLGSVILYDLLCHQAPIIQVPHDHTESPSFNRHLHTGTAGTGQPLVKYPQLVFHPCAFYALGSPIGSTIFECIRGVDALGEDFVLPTCPKFYNIFHPYDPIAYRIEPLLNPRFKDIPPLLIPHHKGRKRMHLELKETMARVGADLKQKLLESIKTTWSNMWKTDANTQQRLEKVVEEEIEKEALNQEEKGDVTVLIDEKAEKLIAGRLNGGRRVDHVLQEAPLEMINEYLFAMSSHVCYWESEDTMLLILREVYDALGIQPDSTVPQQTMTVQRETGPKNDQEIDVLPAELLATNERPPPGSKAYYDKRTAPAIKFLVSPNGSGRSIAMDRDMVEEAGV